MLRQPAVRKLGEDIQHVRERFTCRDCEKISQAPVYRTKAAVRPSAAEQSLASRRDGRPDRRQAYVPVARGR